MVQTMKDFLKLSVLGISVILLTPMLVAFIVGLGGGLGFLTTPIVLGVSLLSFIGAGVIAWLADMTIKRFWK